MNDDGIISRTRFDISSLRALSLDLRRLTGSGLPDESGICEPGTFGLSVHGIADPETGLYVGEIVCILGGKEVRIVGALTGRHGVIEVTPDHIEASLRDDEYRKQIAGWLGIAAA